VKRPCRKFPGLADGGKGDPLNWFPFQKYGFGTIKVTTSIKKKEGKSNSQDIPYPEELHVAEEENAKKKKKGGVKDYWPRQQGKGLTVN